jgi:8-oxo-dGTP diphosphatase
VIVYLVRHARAGHRGDWNGDDRLRPLDERGRLQAERLVGQLDGRNVSRIVSSPFTRCVETVVPLAQARALTLEEDDALAEGAPTEAALELFRGAETPLVACVHGNLAEALLGEKMKKGATTVLEFAGPEARVLEQLAPQA